MAAVLLVLFLSQEVSSLIEQMKSESVQTRDEASRKLLSIGESARVLLEKAAADSDKELSSRAADLLRRMDLRRTLGPILLQELPNVDLKLIGREDQPWTEALAEATRQRFSRRDHPNLRSADLDVLASRALKGCRPDQKASVCRVIAAWNLTSAVPELIVSLKDSDTETRRAALQALRDLEARQAAPSLVEMVKTEQDHWLLRDVLSLLDSWELREAAPELMRQLKSRQNREYDIKGAILATLGTLGTPAMIPDLIDVAMDREALIGMSEGAAAITRLSPEHAITCLLRAASKADAERGALLRMMLCEIHSSKTIPEVRKLLQDPDHRVRMSARAAIRTLGAKEAIPDLKPMLEDADRWTRLDAAQTLASMGDSSGLPVLLKELDDVQLRAGIAAWIGYLDARPAFPRLMEFVKKGDLSIAWIILGQGGEEEVKQVLSCFKDAPKKAREHLGLLLASHGYGDALPLLLPLLKDPDFSVRSQAAERIGELGLREAFGAMVDASREQTNCSHYPMIRCLGRLGGKEAGPILIPLLDDPLYGRRREALIALEESGVEGLLPKVRALLTDEDASVRLQAASWLIRSGQAEGVPALLPGGRGLFALNALRRPDLWKRIAAQRFRRPFSAWGLRGLEEISRATGLRLDLSEELGGRWPSLHHGARDVLEAMEWSNIILESDRILVLPDPAAHRFWRAWWSEEKAKKR